MIMKGIPKLTLLLTAAWLLILCYFSFFTSASANTLMIIYITGQGFLTALVISQWNKKRISCKKTA
ncbi:hypothetical protein BST86_07940 [Nonlabens agnitus]|uniref:Uncharacterized protein n=1 Tax=Nonlabens agnitus TaxID=870484 RepID=A0A2S9WUM4_9FLAO|nr:hypothetical protein BST86_07940 [Nonlabens agnitus]